MRAKRRWRPRRRDDRARVGSTDLADWMLQSEIGWGMPHWLFAVPGMLRQVALALGRAAWPSPHRGPGSGMARRRRAGLDDAAGPAPPAGQCRRSRDRTGRRPNGWGGPSIP